MCKKCGRGVSQASLFKQTIPEGSETLVLTVQNVNSKKVFRSPKTGNTYRAGGKIQEFEAAIEDADWLLGMNKFGKYFFSFNKEATELIHSDLYNKNIVVEEEKEELIDKEAELTEKEIEEVEEILKVEEDIDADTKILPEDEEKTEEIAEVVEEEVLEDYPVQEEKPKRGRKKKEDAEETTEE